MIGVDPSQASTVSLVRGVPAPVNFHTGYAGRNGIFEVMALDTNIREAILHGKSSNELKSLAVTNGMQTLDQVAMAKVRAGITTLEEMHRVLIVGA
jgi:type II secretory ATPase GspE/PulE/Tfp pilus assembly ATPase PilB-like protein